MRGSGRRPARRPSSTRCGSSSRAGSARLPGAARPRGRGLDRSTPAGSRSRTSSAAGSRSSRWCARRWPPPAVQPAAAGGVGADPSAPGRILLAAAVARPPSRPGAGPSPAAGSTTGSRPRPRWSARSAEETGLARRSGRLLAVHDWHFDRHRPGRPPGGLPRGQPGLRRHRSPDGQVPRAREVDGTPTPVALGAAGPTSPPGVPSRSPAWSGSRWHLCQPTAAAASRPLAWCHGPRDRLHLRRPGLKFGSGASDEIGYDLSPARRPPGAGGHRPRRRRDRPPAAGRRPDGALRHRGARLRRRRTSSRPTPASRRRSRSPATTGPWDAFVAVGGGSSIDTAKAVNLLTTNDGELMDYVNAPVGRAGRPRSRSSRWSPCPPPPAPAARVTTICVLDVLA